VEERIQKLISAAGLCSRRAAEELMAAGRVCVNGIPARPGDRADPARDRITVDGAPLGGAEQPVYLMLNKPAGYVTTLSDERGRPTVAELTADVGTRVFPVGRLDLMSEGLLLLTNDGELMQRLTHPKYEVSKTYQVTVAGDVRDAEARLRAVRSLDGEPIRPAEVDCLRRGRETAVFRITIHEGKNRQIRRMCAQCGLAVKCLQRVCEHTLELRDLPVGKWRYLTADEVAALRGGDVPQS
jgi:23S rRNA pseudouridine2605 synthase